MNKSYIIQTDKGKFKLEISQFKNRDTNLVESYGVNVGGPENKCVQIKVPGKDSKIQTGTLIWVESKPTCYIELYNRDKLAQHMVNIGFTIARGLNPVCTRYEFDDCSRITCKLPDGTKKVISMKPLYIAFHGKTWYEHWFNAKLIKDYELYETLKLNIYDSAKKPTEFDFKNESLDAILKPIYNNCKTWHAFFQKISELYSEKKCTVVYPWIYSAMKHIFDYNAIFDNTFWYIDFKENAQIYPTPIIKFAIVKQRGGKFTRRKRINYPEYPVYDFHYPSIAKMDFSKV